MPVYQDKKNKKWFCKVNKKGKQITRRGFKTKREAKATEIELLSAINSTTVLSMEDNSVMSMTLDQVAKEYIRGLDIKLSSSAYTAESLYRLHLSKPLGKRDVNTIKMSDIRDLQIMLLDKKKSNGKYYTNKTINHVTSLLKSILNYAVRFEYAIKNSCLGFEQLKIPKIHNNINFWTDKEFRKAIAFESDGMWYCFLSILYLTGMRKGEIRGLQWRDIDFDKSIIVINRHVNDKVLKTSRKSDTEQRLIEGRKNGGSHVVAMDMNTKKLLYNHKEKEKFKVDYNEKAYIFGRVKPIGQNTPKRHLDEIADRAKLPRITVHGLRHSHVSYLISKGLNPYEIAERIGDTVEMVLNVYGHQFPNPQKNVVKILNDTIDFL